MDSLINKKWYEISEELIKNFWDEQIDETWSVFKHTKYLDFTHHISTNGLVLIKLNCKNVYRFYAICDQNNKFILAYDQFGSYIINNDKIVDLENKRFIDVSENQYRFYYFEEHILEVYKDSTHAIYSIDMSYEQFFNRCVTGELIYYAEKNHIFCQIDEEIIIDSTNNLFNLDKQTPIGKRYYEELNRISENGFNFTIKITNDFICYYGNEDSDYPCYPQEKIVHDYQCIYQIDTGMFNISYAYGSVTLSEYLEEHTNVKFDDTMQCDFGIKINVKNNFIIMNNEDLILIEMNIFTREIKPIHYGYKIGVIKNSVEKNARFFRNPIKKPSNGILVVIVLETYPDSKTICHIEECRTNKCKVIDIYDPETGIHYDDAVGYFRNDFVYSCGQDINISCFRSNSYLCSSGIYFCNTIDELKRYFNNL